MTTLVFWACYSLPLYVYELYLLGARLLTELVGRRVDQTGRGRSRWGYATMLATLVFTGSPASAYLVGPAVPLEELARTADLVCKATVIADRSVTDGWFELISGFEVRETELRVVSIVWCRARSNSATRLARASPTTSITSSTWPTGTRRHTYRRESGLSRARPEAAIGVSFPVHLLPDGFRQASSITLSISPPCGLTGRLRGLRPGGLPLDASSASIGQNGRCRERHVELAVVLGVVV